MTRSLPFNEYLHKKLKNPKDRAAYINAALEDGNPKILLAVLKDCVEATGGISKLSHETHMTRATIYKILSTKGNPKYDSLLKVLGQMGLRLNVSPVGSSAKRDLVHA